MTIAAAERQVIFKRLHEQRADVVAETYSLLRDVHAKLSDYVKVFEPLGDKPRDERRRLAAEAQRTFIEYFSKKRIFVPKAAADQIDHLNRNIVSTFTEFEGAQQPGSAREWMNIFTRVQGEMVVALKQLEDEFRIMLGERS